MQQNIQAVSWLPNLYLLNSFLLKNIKLGDFHNKISGGSTMTKYVTLKQKVKVSIYELHEL